MKGKPIRIDWEELESAFENKTEDLVYYLDLVTGDVVLEGEGEGADDDESEDDMEEVVPIRRDQSTRLYVEPPDPETESAWMAKFVDGLTGADPEVLAKLREAVAAPDPVDSFRDALRANAQERDRWFLFRSDRIHETINTWLKDNGVRPAGPPPWKV